MKLIFDYLKIGERIDNLNNCFTVHMMRYGKNYQEDYYNVVLTCWFSKQYILNYYTFDEFATNNETIKEII